MGIFDWFKKTSNTKNLESEELYNNQLEKYWGKIQSFFEKDEGYFDLIDKGVLKKVLLELISSGDIENKNLFSGEKKVGEWITYDKNGVIRFINNYKDGKKYGLQKSYYDNGTLDLFERNITLGVCVYKKYYQNGQLLQEGETKDDVEVGDFKLWYENGQLCQIGSFKDGKEDGEWKYYYENGNLELKGHFKNGFPNGGENKTWYECGQLKSEEVWENGVVISQKCWDEDGKEIECE